MKRRTAHEIAARQGIASLSLSRCPMTELHTIEAFIAEGCPVHYGEDRRDSLLDMARHVATKQAQRIRDAQMIGRMAG